TRTGLLGVGDAQRGAVDAVESQASPLVLPRALVPPLLPAHLEYPLQRARPHPRPRLRHRAGRYRRLWARKNQAQFPDQIVDRPLPEHRHSHHQPDHLLRRQPPLSHRRGARRRQRLCYPRRVDVLPDVLELLGLRERADRLERPFQSHDLLLVEDRDMVIPSPPSLKNSFLHRISRSIPITWRANRSALLLDPSSQPSL